MEQYYNSGRFVHTLHWLFSQLEDPFLFYQSLGDRFIREGRPVRKPVVGTALQLFSSLLCTDSRPRRLAPVPISEVGLLPAPGAPNGTRTGSPAPTPPLFDSARYYFWIRKKTAPVTCPEDPGTDSKLLYKLVHFEPFSVDVLNGSTIPVVLLFDYRRKDLLGNAKVQSVTLPEQK